MQSDVSLPPPRFAISRGGLLRKRLSARWLLLTAFIGLLIIDLYLLRDNQHLRARLENSASLADQSKAPEFILRTASPAGEGMFSLKNHLGSSGRLLFFDPSCGACKADAATWNDLAHDAKSQGRFFLAISTSPESVFRGVQEYRDLDFDIGFDPFGVIADQYNVPGFPFLYTIDPDGRIVTERTQTEANCVRLGFHR